MGIDFVTAAAPNCGVLKGKIGDQEAASQSSAALRERIRRVLHTFASNGCVDLVLGAWGCGVFRNDPATVARLFDEALAEIPYFRRVIYAVLDPRMARIFGEILQVPVEGLENVPASSGKGKEKGKTSCKNKGKSASQDGYEVNSRKQQRWQKGCFEQEHE